MHEDSSRSPRFSTSDQMASSIRLNNFSEAIAKKQNPQLNPGEMLVFKFPDEKTSLKVEEADAPAQKEQDGNADPELEDPKLKKDLFQLFNRSELDGTWKIAPSSAELKMITEIPSLATLDKFADHLQIIVDQKKPFNTADPVKDGRRLNKMAMMLARTVILHLKEQSATFCADEAFVAELTANKRILKTFGHLLTEGIAKNFKMFVLFSCGYSAGVPNPQGEVADVVALPLSYALTALGVALIPIYWTLQNQFNYAARTQETPIWDRRLGRFQWDYRAICRAQHSKYGGCYSPDKISVYDEKMKPEDVAPAYKEDVVQKYRNLNRGIVAATAYGEIVNAMATLLLMTQPYTGNHSQSSFTLCSVLGALIGILAANTHLRVQTSVAWDSYAIEQHRKTGETIPPLSVFNAGINWRSRDGLKILRVFLPMLTVAMEVYPALGSSLFQRLFKISPRAFAGSLGPFFAIGAAAKVTLYDMRKVGQPLGEKIISHPFPNKNGGGKLANAFAQFVGADFIWQLWQFLGCCKDRPHSDRATHKSPIDLATFAGLPIFLECCYAMGLFFSKQYNLQVVLDHAVLPYLPPSSKDFLTREIAWVITPSDILTAAFAAWGCQQLRKQARTAFAQEEERRTNDLMHSNESEDVSDFAKVQLDCHGQNRDNEDGAYTVSYLGLS